MKPSATHDKRFAKMLFNSVYPLYMDKVKKKGRTAAELQKVFTWLTGFDKKKTEALINEKTTFETFFKQATLNPNAHLLPELSVATG